MCAAPDPHHALLLAFEQERDAWYQAAEWMAKELRGLVKQARIPAEVSARVKEGSSLVLSAYRKNKTSLSEFHDRAAARLSTYYSDDRPEVVRLVCERFACPDGPDDHRTRSLGTDRMGYGGIHCDVLVDRAEVDADLSTISGPIWLEIQVHTLASALWAATGHPLTYKGPIEVSDSTTRAVNTLSVLSEVYDSELTRARTAIVSDPKYPAGAILQAVERYYFGLFGSRDHDRATSQMIVELLMPSLSSEEIAAYNVVLDGFFERNRNALDFIYREQDPAAQQIPLLMQPEALLFFERLEHNAPLLREVWCAALPAQWYDDLVAVWGGEP